MRIFVTGKPGVGKTTLALRAWERFKGDARIAGFVTEEVRERGRRVGFRIRALDTGEEGWLARVGKGDVMVGRYAVNLEDLERVGVSALRRALNSELAIVDEIGAMEMKSRAFAEALDELLRSDVPLLATVHRRFAHQFRNYGELYTLTIENRENLTLEILEKLQQHLGR
ncbi:NTPase [Palaeococcus ferrophilus]|uniref:NTPase n=1 Tax=Palaeococcus ferrophilus TaxID=83868 RepID=UPI00064E33F4|nr:NTPase [Palaeococcus ferrophilus]